MYNWPWSQFEVRITLYWRLFTVQLGSRDCSINGQGNGREQPGIVQSVNVIAVEATKVSEVP